MTLLIKLDLLLKKVLCSVSLSQQEDGSLSTERDYESVVLMKMRQAAERQKLIEEMKKEDEEEED